MIRTTFDTQMTKAGGWGEIHHELCVIRYATPLIVPNENILQMIEDKMVMIGLAQNIGVSSINTLKKISSLIPQYIHRTVLDTGWTCYQIVIYNNKEVKTVDVELGRILRAIGTIRTDGGRIMGIEEHQDFALYATICDLMTAITSVRYDGVVVFGTTQESIVNIMKVEDGEKSIGIGVYIDPQEEYVTNRLKINATCAIFDSYVECINTTAFKGKELALGGILGKGKPHLNRYYIKNKVDKPSKLEWCKRNIERFFELKGDILYLSDSKYGLEEIQQHHDLFNYYGFTVVKNIVHNSVKMSDNITGGSVIQDEIFAGGMLTLLGFPAKSIDFNSIRLREGYELDDVCFLTNRKGNNRRTKGFARSYMGTKTDLLKPMIDGRKSVHLVLSYPTMDSKLDDTVISFVERIGQNLSNRTKIREIAKDMVDYILSFRPSTTTIEDSDDDILVRWFNDNTKTTASTDEHILKMFNRQKEQLIKQYREMTKYLRNYDFSGCRPIPSLKLDKKVREIGEKKLVIMPEKEQISSVMGIPIPTTTNVKITGTLNIIDKKNKKIVHKVFDMDSYYDKNSNSYSLEYNVLKRGKKKC